MTPLVPAEEPPPYQPSPVGAPVLAGNPREAGNEAARYAMMATRRKATDQQCEARQVREFDAEDVEEYGFDGLPEHLRVWLCTVEVDGIGDATVIIGFDPTPDGRELTYVSYRIDRPISSLVPDVEADSDES